MRISSGPVVFPALVLAATVIPMGCSSSNSATGADDGGVEAGGSTDGHVVRDASPRAPDGGDAKAKAKACGGTLEMIADAGGAGIAVDSTDVYFCQWAAGGGSNGKSWIYKAPLAGGAKVEVATPATPCGGVGVDPDGGNVYWTEPNVGTVMRTSKAGGAVFTIGSAQLNAFYITAYGGQAYWTNTYSTGSVWTAPAGAEAPDASSDIAALENPAGIAVDTTGIYVAGQTGIEQLTPAGSVTASFAPTTGQPWGVALQSGYVYWADQAANGDVARASAPGLHTPGPFWSLQNGAGAVAADPSYVYWTQMGVTEQHGSILAGRIASHGAPVTLACNQEAWFDAYIAAGGGYVFWTTGGSIMKTRAPSP
jgi:hypothetical protein